MPIKCSKKWCLCGHINGCNWPTGFLANAAIYNGKKEKKSTTRPEERRGGSAMVEDPYEAGGGLARLEEV